MKIYNGLDESSLDFVNPPNCLNNQYWDGECFDCDSSCSQWPWCVRRTDCNICYSNLQTTCHGYGRNDVVSFTGCNINNCIECVTADDCSKSKYPYFIEHEKGVSSETISIDDKIYLSMVNFLVSYYMQSGNDDSTDFFINKESDDYIPIYDKIFL